LFCSIVDARERKDMYRHLSPSRNSKKQRPVPFKSRGSDPHNELSLLFAPHDVTTQCSRKYKRQRKRKKRKKNINLAEQFILSRLMMCPRGGKDKGKEKRRNKNNLAELFLLSRLMM